MQIIALPFILFLWLLPVAIMFFILYFVIKLAIRNALREHEQYNKGIN